VSVATILIGLSRFRPEVRLLPLVERFREHQLALVEMTAPQVQADDERRWAESGGGVVVFQYGL
jgi:hypothetical protein